MILFLIQGDVDRISTMLKLRSLFFGGRFVCIWREVNIYDVLSGHFPYSQRKRINEKNKLI
jgi:hypothetical protein